MTSACPRAAAMGHVRSNIDDTWHVLRSGWVSACPRAAEMEHVRRRGESLGCSSGQHEQRVPARGGNGKLGDEMRTRGNI